jgi:nucleotide-binding universal stress UspA family protein
MEYQKMLIPIDGSESCLHALKESLIVADREKSCLIAVCVTSPDEDINRADDISEKMSSTCFETFERAKAIARGTNSNVRFIHRTGIVHEHIINISQEYDCDLIVMGRHETHGIKQLITGSVSTCILSNSNCDILIVPHESTIGWSNILVATDGSIYSHGAIESAIDLASSSKGNLHVVSIVDAGYKDNGNASEIDDKMLAQAREFVNDIIRMSSSAGVSCEGHVRIGQPANIILELADEFYITNILMSSLLMSSQGKAGHERSTLGSVATEVIGSSPCPVLIGRT